MCSDSGRSEPSFGAGIEAKTGHQWFARLLLLVVLGGVLLYIRQEFRAIRAHEFSLRWLLLAASFLIAVATYLINYAIWLRLTAAFSLRASLRQSSYAWFVSQLGKYVPGKFTMLLLRMNAYAGQPRRKIAAASGVEFLASVAASAVVVLIGVAFSPAHFGAEVRAASVLLLAVLLIVLYPPFLLRAINFLLDRLKREAITEMPSYGLMLAAVVLYTLNGLIAGIWAFLLFNSLSPLTWSNYLVLTASCYGASLIGFAALFAPGGIGVREGILFLILPLFMPKPTVIVGTILMRLLVIAVELTLAVSAAVVSKLGGGDRLPAPPPEPSSRSAA